MEAMRIGPSRAGLRESAQSGGWVPWAMTRPRPPMRTSRSPTAPTTPHGRPTVTVHQTPELIDCLEMTPRPFTHAHTRVRTHTFPPPAPHDVNNNTKIYYTTLRTHRARVDARMHARTHAHAHAHICKTGVRHPLQAAGMVLATTAPHGRHCAAMYHSLRTRGRRNQPRPT